jgi:hypothetical protein
MLLSNIGEGSAERSARYAAFTGDGRGSAQASSPSSPRLKSGYPGAGSDDVAQQLSPARHRVAILGHARGLQSVLHRAAWTAGPRRPASHRSTPRRSKLNGIALALLLGVTVTGAEASEHHTDWPYFGKDSRWSAVCDNLHTCSAFGFPKRSAKGFLRIWRTAEPAMPPRVTIVLFPSADQATHSEQVQLSMDGASIATLAANAISPREYAGRNPTLTAILSEADLGAFVEQFRSAKHLTITPQHGDRIVLDLDDGRAAVEWLDRAQRFAGTTTALVTFGDAAPPPSSLRGPMLQYPPLRAVPLRRRRLPPAVAEAWARMRAGCNDEMSDDDLLAYPPQLWRLPDGRVLWQFACVGGAYNWIDHYLLQRGTHVQWQMFPDPGRPLGDRPRGSDAVYNPKFDPVSGTVTTWERSRGIGDCGLIARYIWTGRGFRLLWQKEWGTDCSGVMPDQWPTVYVAPDQWPGPDE